MIEIPWPSHAMQGRPWGSDRWISPNSSRHIFRTEDEGIYCPWWVAHRDAGGKDMAGKRSSEILDSTRLDSIYLPRGKYLAGAEMLTLHVFKVRY